MPGIRLREGESFDSAMRRFKRVVEKAGTPKELRRREFHQKGSAIRKRLAAAARKRFLKKQTRDQFALSGGSGGGSPARMSPAKRGAGAGAGAKRGPFNRGANTSERRDERSHQRA